MTDPSRVVARLRELDAERRFDRARLLADLRLLKERVTPANLLQQAKDELGERVDRFADTAVRAVEERPKVAMGVVALVGAALVYSPLRSLWRWMKRGDRDNDAPDPMKSDEGTQLHDPIVPDERPRRRNLRRWPRRRR